MVRRDVRMLHDPMRSQSRAYARDWVRRPSPPP
nr:type VII secretion protein EccB [Nocardia arthritidis]